MSNYPRPSQNYRRNDKCDRLTIGHFKVSVMVAAKDKIKRIYDTLPQLNCGLCGFEGCGQFARAVAEGRASPFGCRQDPWAGYRIGEIMGIKAPVFGYHTTFGQPRFAQRLNPHASIGSLRAEMSDLSKRIVGILDRIDSLKRRVKR
jgi:Na+-translocating ferredoxin:NAD+ oxidoreductase RNF subunit RnfB